MWSEKSILLLLTINCLIVVGILLANQGNRLLLTLLSSILLIHASWLALFTWPIPNWLIPIILAGSLLVVWKATMQNHLHRFDLFCLAFAVLTAWLATTYLPTTLVNATTLVSLPLFVLLPPVYHRLFKPAWLAASFALSLAGAILIIQTAVLYS